jgi:hypothetical protein
LVPLELVIKNLLWVPSVIFFFYGAIYLMLAELNIQPKLSRFCRNASLSCLEAVCYC